MRQDHWSVLPELSSFSFRQGAQGLVELVQGRMIREERKVKLNNGLGLGREGILPGDLMAARAGEGSLDRRTRSSKEERPLNWDRPCVNVRARTKEPKSSSSIDVDYLIDDGRCLGEVSVSATPEKDYVVGRPEFPPPDQGRIRGDEIAESARVINQIVRSPT